ncbi:MAG: hypothetical protein EYC70_15975 [Planctomycetota bacterium]|nr:MAG: hypothetical protein EYC70_15975 [Planctomycetota bacterium]
MKALFLCLLLQAGDPFAEGLRAYREGRFQDALAAFAAAEAAAGARAGAELLHNKALAALRAGDVAAAESAAEQAAARGGPEFAALRDFLLGNAAFQRCAAAAAQAAGPEAEPFAYDVAIAYAESARGAWQRAALRRTDWPEARRNVERALLKLEELRRQREAARRNREGDDRSQPRPQPVPPPERPAEQAADLEQRPEPHRTELAPEQVLRLFEILERKEREKLGLRRSQRRTPRADVDKDW